MKNSTSSEVSSGCDCGCGNGAEHPSPPEAAFPIYKAADYKAADQERSCCESADEPCCGPPAAPPSSPHERPGYKVCGFVLDFMESASGPVPCVNSRLSVADHLGSLYVRLGFGRNDYKVAPGLYAVGKPDKDSAVLVSANYKLSFDHLRRHLTDRNHWILVLDTHGINVWCAAGKGTFGTQEVIRRVRESRLDTLVDHRKLILPQLGATGVNGGEVKKGCGFEVVWGPVLAQDLPAFMDAGLRADSAMRKVTFNLAQRAVLVPVEITLLRKYLLWTLVGIFLTSGIGSHVYSFALAIQRGMLAIWATAAGIVAGTVLVPILLPWLPGKMFSVKGSVTGAVLGLVSVACMYSDPYISVLSAAALTLITTALSSFLAMNFTGSTPFTSPSGVEQEMRKAIPFQLAAIVVALMIWIGTGFGI